MWYKYVDRTSDVYRVFRYKNLQFDHNQFGMFRQKYISKFRYFLYRFCRTQGNYRAVGICLVYPLVLVASHLKGKYYDPVYTEPKLIQQKRKRDELQKTDLAKLQFNNFGVPIKPTDQLLLQSYKQSQQANIKVQGFFGNCQPIYSDELKGLESVPTENDERMVELIIEAKKRYGGDSKH